VATHVGRERPQGAVKAMLTRWLGLSVEQPFSAAAWSTTDLTTQPTVSESSALQLSAVWACVRLLAETIATLPLGFYERTADGRKPATNHPVYELLHFQPNERMTACQFWEVVIASMLLWGNAYVELRRFNGRIVALDFLHPSRVTMRRSAQGDVQYIHTAELGPAREIPEENMWHILAFSTDGLIGISPIRAGANVFGAAMAAEIAAGSTFRRGLLPTTVFKFPGTLKQEQRNDAREAMARLGGAINAGKPVILEAGTEAETIGINPNDAQLLESRAFSVEEICRWFRVPPFMVGHSEKSTSWGTGIEQQMIGFLQFSLRPWLTRIEQAIRSGLLTPAERRLYFAEFVVEGLLRADSAGRATYLATMAKAGFITRNEGRKFENREPMAGGDVLTVESGLVPLDKLGDTPPRAP
jgi:HK97 family phage portal protein